MMIESRNLSSIIVIVDFVLR